VAAVGDLDDHLPGVLRLSLLWLDRLEMRDKRLASVEIEEPEDLAVPIAQ
jgi:hypothetical protein